jgi:hypothetical protein
MTATRKKATEAQSLEVQIKEVAKSVMDVCVIGRSPLIYNSMSQKAKQTLLLPSGRKNAAELALEPKHNPLKEFRDSTYKNLADGPTRLQVPSDMFKRAIMSAALDIPGATKAKIGRLVYMLEDRIDLYGTPQIFQAITRNSGMDHTPDVRTRAIMPRWACRFKIVFVKPLLNVTVVTKLVAAAGVLAGIGDWRVQKGGSYGQFEPCSDGDPEFLSILKEGREAQDAALKSPTAYDDETQKLLLWFESEVANRGKREELSVAA